MGRGTGNCNTTITIRIPKNLKEEIGKQSEELGMTPSSLIKVILKQYFKYED